MKIALAAVFCSTLPHGATREKLEAKRVSHHFLSVASPGHWPQLYHKYLHLCGYYTKAFDSVRLHRSFKTLLCIFYRVKKMVCFGFYSSILISHYLHFFSLGDS